MHSNTMNTDGTQKSNETIINGLLAYIINTERLADYSRTFLMRVTDSHMLGGG